MWKVVYTFKIQPRVNRKQLMNGQHPLHFVVEAIPGIIYIKFYPQLNSRGKYANGFHNSMIDDKDRNIPSPLIMCTCTALHHAVREGQKTKGVHPKLSKSKLKAGRPDRSNFFNYKHGSSEHAACCTSMGCKSLILPGGADRYTFLTNTWNILPES